jgi:hypothetical protein
VHQIVDWDSFHEVFARALGFPSFYGDTLDSWIDCLSSADDAGAGMVSAELVVPDGAVLTLDLGRVDDFAERCPEQFATLNECAAFVNWRRMEQGASPVLALSYYKG